MLFPSFSMAVIEYTCITSVSEYSKSVKVSKGAKIRNRYNQVPHLTQAAIQNELKFLIMVSYTILQPTLHTLFS